MFIYSEKATKFCEISTVDLTVSTKEQIYGGDFAKICGLLRIYELYVSKYLLWVIHKNKNKVVLLNMQGQNY